MSARCLASTAAFQNYTKHRMRPSTGCWDTTWDDESKRQQQLTTTNLDEHLGTLDVGDERHRVVDGHSSRAVTLRHERRRRPRPAVTHRQVDDEVKLVVGEVVGDGALMDAVLSLFPVLAGVFVRPIDGLDLQTWQVIFFYYLQFPTYFNITSRRFSPTNVTSWMTYRNFVLLLFQDL